MHTYFKRRIWHYIIIWNQRSYKFEALVGIVRLIINWQFSWEARLSFKDAFLFQNPVGQNISRAKLIWNSAIPLSKSLLSSRLVHNKLPIDENLIIRGCQILSMCSLCSKEDEEIFHLLCACHYAQNMRNWLSSKIKFYIHHSSIIIHSFAQNMRNWLSSKIKWMMNKWNLLSVELAFYLQSINNINVIWFSRNQSRFNNKHIPWTTAANIIISNTSLSGNYTQILSSNSIPDFSIVKAFAVRINNPNPPLIMKLSQNHPFFLWIKCNLDGGALDTCVNHRGWSRIIRSLLSQKELWS